MNKLRVIIADDHKVVRAGLRLLLEQQPDFEVAGEAGTYGETIDVVKRAQPDLALVDLSMPQGSGVELIAHLKRAFPQVRVVVLTMHDEYAYFREALANGAVGYVLKSAADTELLAALRTVAAGGVFASASIKAAIPKGETPLGWAEATKSTDSEALRTLSSRELEVLRGLALGKTNQNLADELDLSVKTVESYRARMMTKLALHNRAELVQFALRTGLVSNTAS